MTPEQFVKLLSFMQEHGSSVDLNWGEDTNRWECAWITGGLRYIGHAETAVEAAREAYYNARAGAVARTTGEKP